MSKKESTTFRCDADILEALDYLGRKRYHAKTPPGYDRFEKSQVVAQVHRQG
jgi:hypothetical protein